MRLFIPFLLAAALAPAQVVSVGVKAGVPVTSALSGYEYDYTSMLDTGRWTVGPTIEFRLVWGLSVEADALYRGYRYQHSSISAELTEPDGTTYPAFAYSYRSNTKVWDVPLLLKYRIGSRRYRPFVDAGATFSHQSSDLIVSSSCLSSASVCAASSFATYYGSGVHLITATSGSTGPTAGAGVEFKIGRFRLSPEVRYTHFSNSTRNLATVMLGFTY